MLNFSQTNFLNDKNCRSCTVYDPDRDMIHRIIQFHNIIRKTTEYGLTIGRDGPLPKAYEIPKLVICTTLNLLIRYS